MAKTIKNRKEFQEGENLPNIETNLPGTRFQEDAQVATPSQVKSTSDLIKGDVAPGQQGTVASAATAVKKKMSIRPSSEAGLGDGKQVGGVPLGSTAANFSVAGASNVNPAVDMSKIPYTAGGYRPSSRYGKKNTVDNFVLNNTISEQVEPTFEESKDLREAPNATQGYNGIKQFKTARGKKNAGTTPSSLLYERSIDFVEHGSVVHTSGQVLDNIVETAGYPTRSYVNGQWNDIEQPMAKANYLLKGLNITIENGKIKSLSIDEDCFMPGAQGVAVEQANQNWQVDANNVAHTIVKLQNDLGRETTDKWSPLGYVIEQPYQYNMLMHDIEATTGAIAGAAYRSSAHSLSYSINKRGKDGAQTNMPIMDLCCGSIANQLNSVNYDDADIKSILFDDKSEALRKGSPAAMIKMFDSTGKYSTFADFMNQPRSFKLHLQTVDNNLNPLHAKEQFFKALDKVSLFSTEDGNYNPVLPIHTTSSIKLMNPLSLNAFLNGWKNPSDVAKLDETERAMYDDLGFKTLYNYQYNDLRNSYEWKVNHPIVAGLVRWLLRHESSVVKAYGANNSIHWPAEFSNTTLSMFALAICSASQDILWMRNVIMRDAIFAGEQETYIWNDLTSLSELNPVQATQYTYTEVGSPLKVGEMSNASKIRIFWPEHIGYRRDKDSAGANTASNSYLLPWYFNEQQFTSTARSGEGFLTGPHPNCMSYPSIRSGVNHDMIDLLYSMTEKDVRLCLDRMVDLPMPTAKVTDDLAAPYITGDTYRNYYGGGIITDDTITNLNKAINISALRYDTQSDGRVVLSLASDGSYAVNDDLKYLKNSVYYTVPRELGYIFPMITAYATPLTNDAPSATETDALTDLTPINGKADGSIDGSSYIGLVCYRAYGDGIDPASISRTASLKQRYVKTFAVRDVDIVNINDNNIDETGIVPALSAIITAADNADTPSLDSSVVSKRCLYVTNSNNHPTGHLTTNQKVVSMQNFFWTIIQRLFMPINLFEYCYDVNDEKGIFPAAVTLVDPMEVCSYFGFAGCLASDFNQDVLERLNVKDQLGIYYIQDEFIKSSLIFRD